MTDRFNLIAMPTNRFLAGTIEHGLHGQPARQYDAAQQALNKAEGIYLMDKRYGTGEAGFALDVATQAQDVQAEILKAQGKGKNFLTLG